MNPSKRILSSTFVALSVAAVGCSSTPTAFVVSDVDAGATDAAVKRDTGTNKADSSANNDDAGSADSGALACGPATITEAELTAITKPTKAAVKGACTATELDAIKAVYATAKSFAELSAPFTGTCRACAITDVKPGGALQATEWGALVLISPDGDGKGVTSAIFNTYAACGIGAGVSSECPQRLTAFDRCNATACRECTDDAERMACGTAAAASGGVCRTAPAVTTKCTSSDLQLISICAPKAKTENNEDVFIRRIASYCGPA
jgi:hypothetical protein